MTGRRLYIFDIDGTLVRTGGAGSGAMRAAFKALWRGSNGFDGIEFSGRSDRALFRQALAVSGLDGADFEERLRRFKRAYFRRLPQTLEAFSGSLLPGVGSLLQRLAEDKSATVILGTGNFRRSSAIKLQYYGIDRFFNFGVGGFGDRTEDRATLIESALRSARRAHGRHDAAFVIGDTVHDVAAARANNVIAVGVATGTTSRDELAAAGADLVLGNLDGWLKE